MGEGPILETAVELLVAYWLPSTKGLKEVGLTLGLEWASTLELEEISERTLFGSEPEEILERLFGWAQLGCWAVQVEVQRIPRVCTCTFSAHNTHSTEIQRNL